MNHRLAIVVLLIALIFSPFHIFAQVSSAPSAASLLNQASLIQESLKAQGITTPPIFSRLLILGTKGEDVKNLQKLLNQDPATKVAFLGPGSPGQETDFFGPATKAALIRFQIKNGIEGVGHAGPATRAKLTLIAQGLIAKPLAQTVTQSQVTTKATTTKLKETAAEKKVRLAAEKAAKAAKLAADKAAKTAAEQTLANVKVPAAPTTSSTQTTTTSGSTNTQSPSQSQSGSGECFDSKDNDNDGQTDFADFGCFGPNGQETTKNYGFTLFTPSSDTKIIYVSNSTGSDTNDGLSAEKAVKTIAKGIALLRTGSPDWMLLKRGDVWTENLGSWKKSGRSSSEKMIVSGYGPSAERPMLKTGIQTGITVTDPVSNVAVVGINFYASGRDPSLSGYNSVAEGVGISWFAGSNILIEDCVFRFYASGMNFQVFAGSSISNVALRRNIITDAYTTASHSQGIYTYYVQGLLMEGNLFDHNGWNERINDEATIFDHNAYIKETTTGVVIRDNIFSRASSHGLQARAGGDITDNLFLNNPIGMSWGYVNGSPAKAGGITGIVANNVFLGSASIAGSPRGWAIEVSNTKPGGQSTIQNNIIAHDSQKMYTAITLGYGNITNPNEAVGINNLTIKNNTVYDWLGGMTMYSKVAVGDSGQYAFKNISVQNNTFTGTGKVISHSIPINLANESFSGNTYDTSIAKPFGAGSVDQTFSEWKSAIEPTAQNAKITYKDPDRTIATYMKKVGGAQSLDGFIAEVRQQSRFNWRSEFAPAAMNEYIRDGFTIRDTTPIISETVTQTQTPPASTQAGSSNPTAQNPTTPPPVSSGPIDISSGLVSYYAFDSDLQDRGSSGNNGSNSAESSFVSGKIGQALSLEAGGNVNIKDGWNSALGDSTLAAWVKMPSAQHAPVFTTYEGFGGHEITLLYSTRYNSVSCTIGTDTVSVSVSLDSAWHHIACTRATDGTIIIYVDGIAKKTQVTSVSGTLNLQYNNYLKIGQTGEILDEVRIYNRVLAPQDIYKLASGSLSKIPTVSNLASPSGAVDSLKSQFTSILNQLFNLFGN